jgi:hypothetical protein
VSFDDSTLAEPTATLPSLGSYAFTLDVGVGPFVQQCETSVDVVDTTPPQLDVPADVVLRTSERGPDACALSHVLEARARDACSPSVTVTHLTVPDVGSGGATAAHVFPPGTTRVVFRAVDASGNEAVRETSVTVVDDTPPVIDEVVATPAVLWPPNHRLWDVMVRVEASDNCDDALSITLLDVTSSEPADATGDGHTQPDIVGAETGTADFRVRLRAERDGERRGRTYILRYAAEDDAGNRTVGAARVLVPHDQRKAR